MKGIKRLLATFLTVALLSALIAVPTSAAEMDDAIKLETIGVLKGMGSGVNAAYRASVPTRYQAAWLFLRLLGRETVAQQWAGVLNFTDASTAKTPAGSTLNAENKTMLAYLFANKRIGFIGYPDETFRPFEEVDAQMYYKLMLVALGYIENTDFTWPNVFDKCVEFGLTDTAPTNDGTFTIDKLSKATVEALKANLKGGAKTLIERLVEDDKAVAKNSAILAGLYEGSEPTDPTDPTVLGINSVTADTLGEISINFNKAIDADTLANGFTVGGTVVDAALGATSGMVIVTVPASKWVNNGESYTIEVLTSVKSTDGKALAAKYTKTLNVYDQAAPYVQSVALTGPQTFEILFSETLNPNVSGQVKVNNGAIGIISPPPVNGKKVIVTFGTTFLPEGQYALSISGFKDLAGFSMQPTSSFTLGYIKDNAAPTVKINSATQTSITFEFSKPVSNALNPANYYHTFPHYTPTTVTHVSGNVYMASFPAHANPIPESSTTFCVRNDLITDGWGNKMSSNAEFNVTVQADKTPPYVTQILASQDKKIEIYFSEVVNNAEALASENYVVTLNGVKQTPNLIQHSTFTENNQTRSLVTLNWNTALPGGAYSISIRNIHDAAITPNKMADYLTSILVTDTTPINPALVRATLVPGPAVDMIYVTYPELMNQTAMSKAMYRIKYADNNEAALGSADTIEAHGTLVYRITRPHDAKLTTDGLTKLVIGPVQDASGNAMHAFSYDVPLLSEAPAAVVANTVEQTDYNRISVQFDKVLNQILPEALYIKVGATDYSAAVVDSMLAYDGKTLVSFTLTGDCVMAIKTIAGANYETNTAQILGNDLLSAIQVHINGNYITTNTGMKGMNANLTGMVRDKRIPKLSSHGLETVGGVTKAVLRFSETLSGTNAAFYAADLEVRETAAGAPLVAGIEYETTVVGGNLHIEIANAANSALGYFINSKTEVLYIKDAAGNSAQPFAQFQLTN